MKVQLDIKRPDDLVEYITREHEGCWTWIEGCAPPEIEDWAEVIEEALRRGLVANYFAGGWDVREGLEIRSPNRTLNGLVRRITDWLTTRKWVPGYPSAATRK